MSTIDKHPLASEGGVKTAPNEAGDPFSQLDDLMQVVEALCPTYPQRDTFKGVGGFRL
ncbi:MAG: hypothetical protein JSR66_24965 [Proteobacteria bacterium]|nr:hypothetical protein [Pseudomonadota bacterium]